MTTLSFQRARKPAEQQLRREAILTAAAELFDAEGPHGAGLNAIAARAGFTKSNIYRYFESREEVLISLFIDELDSFVTAFENGVLPIAAGDIEALATLSAATFIARPRFCALMTILSSVLEQNVSVDKVLTLKQSVIGQYMRIASAIASRMPGASIEDCAWVGAMTANLVAGMWPNVTPSPVAAEVLARPEFSNLKPTPERDIARAVKALLASIA